MLRLGATMEYDEELLQYNVSHLCERELIRQNRQKLKELGIY